MMQLSLSGEAQKELSWWIDSLDQANGKRMIVPSADLVITMDTSKKGWGAECQGETTQGLWSMEEAHKHMNCLELLAAKFAIVAFVKEWKDLHIHVRSDNRATVAQINKMGGTRSMDLFKETKELWSFALMRGITVTAELPGDQNLVAD